MIKCSSLALIGVIILTNGYLASAQIPKEILCATPTFQSQCQDMLRGSSEVNCVIVQDPIECAMRIRNGTADFGLFPAESTLQLAVLDWPELVVTKELRHKSRNLEPVDFESVVIVRADHQGGLEGLRGKRFCHPGLFFDRTQRWSERFQKHFERTIITPDCVLDGRDSTAEVEASALSRFFSQVCRPGSWSANLEEDRILKERYPSLCSLCGTEGCSYVNGHDGSGPDQHNYALHCLMDRGDVAYVSKQEAIAFFNDIGKERVEEFAYMCPNGSLYNILDNNIPCPWMRQPWGVILSTSDKAISHRERMVRWLEGNDIWKDALRTILFNEDRVLANPPGVQKVKNYVGFYTDIPQGQNPCVRELNWCTTSRDEVDKCKVMSAGGITTGTLPTISCEQSRENVLQCLNAIRSGEADLMVIDSNYGYLARNVYNLAPALYAETEQGRYASVAILVHRDTHYNSLENLAKRRVCMPEYGGIASVAFVNTLRAANLIDQNECNLGRVMGDHFAESCIPGARDILHDPQGIVSDRLCSLCRTSVAPPPPPPVVENADVLPEEQPAPRSGDVDGEDSPPADDETTATHEHLTQEERMLRSLRGSCAATVDNRYYGNRGALQCLDEIGEVAVLEAQYLNDHARDLRLHPDNYRILCRNGSLALNTGFNVDEDCYLTTIIDSEVVVRQSNSSVTDIINTMLSLDRYFLSNPPFKMYNVFGGIQNLLFKDSTMGLQSAQAPEHDSKVEAYRELFRNVELCTRSAASSVIVNVVFTVFLLLGARLVMH